MISLALKGQAKKRGSVRMMENSTYTSDLVRTLESAPATCTGSIHPKNQPGRSITSNKKINSEQMVLDYLAYVNKTQD